MAIEQKLYTADDLLKLSADDHTKKYEIVRGELRKMSPSGFEASAIAAFLGVQLGNYVYTHQLGIVTGADGGFILTTDPDIVRAPDLAVEVVSPHDTATEVEEKVTDYLRYGVRLIWVIYPKSRTVMIHTFAEIIRATASDTLDGGDVLPGFSLRLRDVFAILPSQDTL